MHRVGVCIHNTWLKIYHAVNRCTSGGLSRLVRFTTSVKNDILREVMPTQKSKRSGGLLRQDGRGGGGGGADEVEEDDPSVLLLPLSVAITGFLPKDESQHTHWPRLVEQVSAGCGVRGAGCGVLGGWWLVGW